MPIYYLAFILLWLTPGYTTPPSSSKALSNKRIEHNNLLFSNIRNLYLNKRFSDVVLVVDGERMHAHRFILASRSEYFRVLFYGGLKETYDEDVVINETHLASFKMLLKYIYTGRININIKFIEVFEVLKVANFFGTLNLKSLLLDFLQQNIMLGNVCWFYSTALFYEYKELEAKSLYFIEKNVQEVLRKGDFHRFSSEALQEILNRDTFYANELDIFHAVCRWIKSNQNELRRDTKVKVLSAVRYPLMYDYQLSEAKKTKLVSLDIILDAIKLRKLSPEKSQLRGKLKPNKNLNYRALHFQVDGRNNSGTIMMMLKNPSFINYIEIHLWFDLGQPIDRLRSYSYYIEVSMDGHNWTLLIDHSNYNCHATQCLWVHPQVVWYIRFVGTNSTANAGFDIKRVCYDTINGHKLEVDNGLVVPKAEYNVATKYNDTTVIKGENSVVDNTFLTYFYEDNKRYGIYTYHRLRTGSIVIHLTQPYILSSMRLLLWGGDKQTYSYTVEASVDGQNWKMIVDKSKKLARSWQVLQFERMPILYIRIIGVYSSSDNEFRCVYFEAPSRVISDSDVVEEDRVEITKRNTTMAESSSRKSKGKAKFRH